MHFLIQCSQHPVRFCNGPETLNHLPEALQTQSQPPCYTTENGQKKVCDSHEPFKNEVRNHFLSTSKIDHDIRQYHEKWNTNYSLKILLRIRQYKQIN